MSIPAQSGTRVQKYSDCTQTCMYVDKICGLYEEGEEYDSMKEKKAEV